MNDILLIHGSAHGAWCWDHLIPHLQAHGHTARAIDLPSHGADRTPAERVTLELYTDAILSALRPGTVVVAHSMAGYPATLAADRAPQMVEKLIYLCAHIPVPGKSIADMRALADSQPLADAMIRSADGKTIRFDPAMARDKFYHDVPADLADWAVANLCPQAVLPQTTAYPAGPAQVHDKYYIRCMDDRAIPPSYQVARTADWPAERVSALATSHSPFLSDPAGLAAELNRILGR